MDDVVAWIASALVRLEQPDPATAPASLSRALEDAFGTSWDGRALVDPLGQDLLRRSGGQVSLQGADRGGFTVQLRGPAAYLELTARRRVLLVPDPALPVRFDA